MKISLISVLFLQQSRCWESIWARSSVRAFLDIVSGNATHILRKHFKLLYEHWITEAVKSVRQQNVWWVRAALQRLSEKADSCERHAWELDQERCAFNKPFRGCERSASETLHAVDYDISASRTPQIRAATNKDGGSYTHSFSLWILNIHTSAHALYVQPCTPRHGQNALKIYDLNIPAGSSNLSSPAHSGFNYTADCRERLF